MLISFVCQISQLDKTKTLARKDPNIGNLRIGSNHVFYPVLATTISAIAFAGYWFTYLGPIFSSTYPPARRTMRISTNSRSGFIACVSVFAMFVAGCIQQPEDGVDLEARLQAELDALRQEYGFPGATAALALADGATVTAATGLADVESEVPMSPSSRMLAASIGKTFVSATVLGLAQEERIDLDSTISRWLGEAPWFERLPNHDTITVRQLLTHRSGLPNHVDTPAFAEAFATNWDQPGTPVAPPDLIEFVLDEPAVFAAGEGWSYTDTGYILLGMVIEASTTDTFYSEVERRFLGPLGLDETSPSDHKDLPGLAAGYMAPNNRFQLPAKTLLDDGRMAWNPAIEWTGGGFVTTSRDLVAWAKALFEGRAMDGPYLDELLRGAPVSDEAPSVRFGAGVAIRDTGPIGPWYSHGGWIPGYVSSLRYYPEHRAAIAFQINTDIGMVDDSTDLYEQMAARLEQLAAAPADD